MTAALASGATSATQTTNPPPSTQANPLSIAATIHALPQLPMRDVRALWKELFGDDTPTHNRQFLERRIAYRLQEVEFRKLDPHLIERNQRRIRTILETGQNKKLERDFHLDAGTTLTREYQGKEYRVMVTVDGQYEFEGCLYRSLSGVAKAITGVAWSGPAFFGLKSTATPKPAKQKLLVKKGARP
jgi:Protein of unknown function (DUF2924)